MITLTVAAIATAVDGRLSAASDPTATVDRVVTDSRQAGPGAVFVALRGEQADGHDFIAGAVAAGVTAHLTERDSEAAGAIVVDDTWRAIGELGRHVRAQVDPEVIAITGSVGKTTTKDLTGAACAAGLRTVAAKGSFNNELGVPLTLLSITDDTEVLVAEIGSRGPGHIAALTPLVQPDVAIVTAVVGVHLEMFGDLDTVASSKGELVAALGADGTAILNADDPRVAAMASLTRARTITYSAVGGAAEVRAEQVSLDAHARAAFTAVTPWGSVDVQLPLSGVHHVGNALAALAAACVVGVEIGAAGAALSTAEISAWRSAVADHAGVRILNDAYNASPTSVAAALTTLEQLAPDGRRWAVLGVMAEIGDTHDAAHHDVGVLAAASAHEVVVVGDDAAGIAAGAAEAGGAVVHRVADAATATALLMEHLERGDAVLVKASRVAGLERVAVALAAHLDGTTA